MMDLPNSEYLSDFENDSALREIEISNIEECLRFSLYVYHSTDGLRKLFKFVTIVWFIFGFLADTPFFSLWWFVNFLGVSVCFFAWRRKRLVAEDLKSTIAMHEQCLAALKALR